MKLIYHPFSPFARLVYLLARELSVDNQITLEKVVVCPIPYPGWSDNNNYVSAHNPNNKIPVLVLENGQSIFDSRVICAYLESLAGRQRERDEAYWVEQTIVSSVHGLLDAEVLTVYEDTIRAENGVRLQVWVDGQRTKVGRAMDFLESMVSKQRLQVRASTEEVQMADIAAAVACAFLDSRNLEWAHSRPGLANYFEKTWRERPCFLRTDPETNWKTGEKSTSQARTKGLKSKI